MDNNSNQVIFQEWPKEDLESLGRCPYCGNVERSIAHPDTRDWSFRCAPGIWAYWTCKNCRTLYLDPRPTISTIGRAYDEYYTHSVSKGLSNAAVRFMKRLRNECLFQWYRIDQVPRLERYPYVTCLLNPLRAFVPEFFPLTPLAAMHPGSLLDVGCGNGDLMRKARSMGWDVSGLEIDEKAVQAARQNGLNIIQGSFEQLEVAQQLFDCVVCSHVIEHVHKPLKLIRLIVRSTRPGGTIFLALPNERSLLRKFFGKYWRGLEAPRHLSLPSETALVQAFKAEGVSDISIHPSPFYTFGESMRLKNGKISLLMRLASEMLNFATSIFPLSRGQDMLQIIIKKGYE